MVLMLVLGVLVDHHRVPPRHRQLDLPRRRRTRWPGAAGQARRRLLVGLLAGLAYVVVNAGLAVPLFSGRGGDLPPTGDLVAVYAGVVVSFALLCAFGLGVGAIVRNQVGAIIAAIAFFFVLSPLPELLPGSIGEYFPAQAVGSLHGSAEGDANLGQVAGGLVLAAWALALCAIGTLLICRRDVTELAERELDPLICGEPSLIDFRRRDAGRWSRGRRRRRRPACASAPRRRPSRRSARPRRACRSAPGGR